VNETLELGRQHHVDHHNGENQREGEILERLRHVVGHTHEPVAVPGGKVRLLDEPGQFLHRLAQYFFVLLQVGQNGDLAGPVEPVDLDRSGLFLDPRDILQLHELTFHVPHGQQLDILRTISKWLLQPDADIVPVAFRLEFADVVAPDERLDRGRHRQRTDAQVGRAIALHIHADLRLALFVCRIQVHVRVVLLHLVHQLRRDGLQPVEVRSPDLDLEIRFTLPAARHASDNTDADARILDVLQIVSHPLHRLHLSGQSSRKACPFVQHPNIHAAFVDTLQLVRADRGKGIIKPWLGL